MVATITYNEKKYPYKVSYLAQLAFLEETGREFVPSNKINADSLRDVETIIYHGIKTQCERQKIEFDIPRDEMKYVLDDQLPEIIQGIFDFFQQAPQVQRTNPKNPKGRR